MKIVNTTYLRPDDFAWKCVPHAAPRSFSSQRAATVCAHLKSSPLPQLSAAVLHRQRRQL